jgi:hypothetical protein
MISKIPALELLCRYKGMLIDKHQIEHSGRINTVGDLVKYARNKMKKTRVS